MSRKVGRATNPVFRNSLYKYFETIQPGDWDGYLSSLDKAGNTLDYRRYTDQLFEILIVGGLLAPGGSYLDDGAPMSAFSVSYTHLTLPTNREV